MSQFGFNFLCNVCVDNLDIYLNLLHFSCFEVKFIARFLACRGILSAPACTKVLTFFLNNLNSMVSIEIELNSNYMRFECVVVSS